MEIRLMKLIIDGAMIELENVSTKNPLISKLFEIAGDDFDISRLGVALPVSDGSRKFLGRLTYLPDSWGSAINPKTKIHATMIRMGSYSRELSKPLWLNSPFIVELIAMEGARVERDVTIKVPKSVEAAEILGMLTILPDVANDKDRGDNDADETVAKAETCIADLPISLEEMCKSTEELELPTLTQNALTNGGVMFIWQLLASMEADLLRRMKFFGRKGLASVKDAIDHRYGARLNSLRRNQIVALSNDLSWTDEFNTAPIEHDSYMRWVKGRNLPDRLWKN